MKKGFVVLLSSLLVTSYEFKTQNLNCTIKCNDEDIAFVRPNISEENSTCTTILASTSQTSKDDVSKHDVSLHFLKPSNISFRNHKLEGTVESLKLLNLSYNLITSFDFESIKSMTSLQELILSHNLIEELKNADLSNFHMLNLLDVSDNFLTWLPEGLQMALQDDRGFKLIYNNNPWNCSKCDSSKVFGGASGDKLCSNICSSEQEPINFQASFNADVTEQVSCPEGDCSFMRCIIWTIGSFWIGIIIGNSWHIRKMLFKTPNRTPQGSTFENILSLYMSSCNVDYFQIKETKLIALNLLNLIQKFSYIFLIYMVRDEQ